MPFTVSSSCSACLTRVLMFYFWQENSAGALTSFLSTETTHLAGMSGVTLGTILVVSTTLIAAIALACSIGWKLGLVCSATIPILLACGYLRFWMLGRFQERAKKAYENSASYACEATAAIRTVASLTREADVWNHYHETLVAQGKTSLKSVLRSSTLYASSQSLMFLCNALVSPQTPCSPTECSWSASNHPGNTWSKITDYVVCRLSGTGVLWSPVASTASYNSSSSSRQSSSVLNLPVLYFRLHLIWARRSMLPDHSRTSSTAFPTSIHGLQMGSLLSTWKAP